MPTHCIYCYGYMRLVNLCRNMKPPVISAIAQQHRGCTVLSTTQLASHII
jgi:hypothetical protein